MSILSKCNKIVLAAGHGGRDPGAISPNGDKESDNNTFITNLVATNLRAKGLKVDVVPNNLDLGPTIDWINSNYFAFNPNRSDNVWCLEFHRDMNAPNLPAGQKDNQMGVYYFDENRDGKESPADGESHSIAKSLMDVFMRLGAYTGKTANLYDFDGSWIKDHHLDWVGYGLGFIERTGPITHLIEHGYMSGRCDKEHLTKLANWTSQAIFETFTGKPYNSSNPSTPPPIMSNPPVQPVIDEKTKVRELIKKYEGQIPQLKEGWVVARNDIDGPAAFVELLIKDIILPLQSQPSANLTEAERAVLAAIKTIQTKLITKNY